MASAFGANRNMVCPGCKLKYDDFRAGWLFKNSRREIIALKVDRKTGKTKYGRRRGTLGFMHEQKMLCWDQHVGECTDAREKAAQLDAFDDGTRVAEHLAFAARQLVEQRTAEREARRKAGKHRRKMIRAGQWKFRKPQIQTRRAA